MSAKVLLLRLSYSPPSLRHFVTQGLLPSVVVLECGFSLPVCGFVRTFNCLIDYKPDCAMCYFFQDDEDDGKLVSFTWRVCYFARTKCLIYIHRYTYTSTYSPCQLASLYYKSDCAMCSVWGVVLVVCVCVFRCRGCCSLSECVCDLLIFLNPHSHPHSSLNTPPIAGIALRLSTSG